MESALERASDSIRASATSVLLGQALRAASLAPAWNSQKELLGQVSPKNARSVLQTLAIQSRYHLTKRLDDFQLPTTLPFRPVRSSGTTTKPLEIYRTQLEDEVEHDFVQYAWQRLALPHNARGAALTGRQLSDGDHKVDRNGFLWISCRELNSSTWRRVSELLDYHERDYLRGYGSLVGEYYAAISRSEAQPPRLARVAYSSDAILPQHRQIILEVTGRLPVGLYGQTERAIMAATCEFSDTYHTFETYGHTEIVGENGCPITRPDVPGELVGTSLWPRATGILRYATGDRAVWIDGECGCGRSQARFHLIAGRSRERLVGADGETHLLGPAIYDPILEAVSPDCTIQFAQPKPGTVILRMSRSTPQVEQVIRRHLVKQLGDGFTISIAREAPIRTSAGKRPLLDASPSIDAPD